MLKLVLQSQIPCFSALKFGHFR